MKKQKTITNDSVVATRSSSIYNANEISSESNIYLPFLYCVAVGSIVIISSSSKKGEEEKKALSFCIRKKRKSDGLHFRPEVMEQCILLFPLHFVFGSDVRSSFPLPKNTKNCIIIFFFFTDEDGRPLGQ